MMRFGTRDEREAALDLAGDRIALSVLSFGLLAIVAYRAFATHESSWDLLGLLVASGIAGYGYRLSRGVATREIGLALLAVTIVGALVAVAVGVVLPR